MSALIRAHVVTHYGPMAVDLGDVGLIAPSEDDAVWTLCTLGMSTRLMDAPPTAPRAIELVLRLPFETWAELPEAVSLEAHWAVRWLRALAALPAQASTFLAAGHTVPNGDPPAPLCADTAQCMWLVFPPVSLDDAALTCAREAGEPATFLALYGMYAEEHALLTARGLDEVIGRWIAADVGDVFAPARRNVAVPAR